MVHCWQKCHYSAPVYAVVEGKRQGKLEGQRWVSLQVGGTWGPFNGIALVCGEREDGKIARRRTTSTLRCQVRKISSFKPGTEATVVISQASVGMSAVIIVDRRLDGVSLEILLWVKLWALGPRKFGFILKIFFWIVYLKVPTLSEKFSGSMGKIFKILFKNTSKILFDSILH